VVIRVTGVSAIPSCIPVKEKMRKTRGTRDFSRVPGSVFRGIEKKPEGCREIRKLRPWQVSHAGIISELKGITKNKNA